MKTIIRDGEVTTSLALEGEDLVVRRSQDAEDIVNNAKMLAEQPQHGADFHHIWSLPATVVEQFFNEYCGRDGFKPMNDEFWQWVNKRVKGNTEYSKFWTYNPSKPFWMAYGPTQKA